jgi:hypothetical protein
MNERTELIGRIRQALGKKALVWFGIRGEDATPYLAIPQFSACFSIAAPLSSGALHDVVALEQLTGHRVDLDQHDIDFDDDARVLELRRRVLTALHRDSALVTYRPSHFLSATHFASLETCDYLGQFKDRQLPFEHKPWVETMLARLGVRTLPWHYVADEHKNVIRRDIERGPCILRPSHSSGGEGITLIEHPDDVDRLWPVREDHLVSVAPYFSNAVPVNVGGCVFDGEIVTLHPASVQLIGIPTCTSRQFGYCGNDFAAVRALPTGVLDELTATSLEVGRWLARQGYFGAFGIDYLVDDEVVYFTELNARMQGSSAPAAELSAQLGVSDLILEHLAAGLGLAPVAHRTLGDWASDLPDFAHVVVHNTENRPVANSTGTFAVAPPAHRLNLVPDARIAVNPGGTLARLCFEEQITSSGFDVTENVDRAVTALMQAVRATDSGRKGA